MLCCLSALFVFLFIYSNVYYFCAARFFFLIVCRVWVSVGESESRDWSGVCVLPWPYRGAVGETAGPPGRERRHCRAHAVQQKEEHGCREFDTLPYFAQTSWSWKVTWYDMTAVSFSSSSCMLKWSVWRSWRWRTSRVLLRQSEQKSKSSGRSAFTAWARDKPLLRITPVWLLSLLRQNVTVETYLCCQSAQCGSPLHSMEELRDCNAQGRLFCVLAPHRSSSTV